MKNPDPLENLKTGIGVFVSAVALLSTVVNVWAFFTFSPLSFQRLGSIWIALVLLSFGVVRYLVSEINKAVSGRGPWVDLMQKKLGPVIYSEDKGWLNYMSKEGVEYEHPLRTIEEVRELVSDLDGYVATRVLPTEIWIGAFATIQWGYGDLLMNRTVGCGTWTC